MKRSQHVHMTIPRTILHVAEAMREARVTNPETVGEHSDYVVITAKRIRRLPKTRPCRRCLRSMPASTREQ
jgi:hypothetical protein